MRNSVVALAIVVGCTPNTDPKKKADVAPAKAAKKIDALKMQLPEGWQSAYRDDDTWRFTHGDVIVILERAPRESANSPEALRHYLQTKQWPEGTTAEITSREATSDGFAATLAVASKVPHVEVYVMKELHNEWFRCYSTSVDDDALPDQVVALCKSIK